MKELDWNSINPTKSALLIIDMEKGFVEPGAALCIAGAKETVPAIADVIHKCRSIGVKIIWVKRIYAKDGSDMEIPRWKDLCARGYQDAGVLAPDSTGLHSIEEPEGLAEEVRPEDLVIIKPRFSAYFGTKLHEILSEAGIDTVLLTGTTTPNCIRSTCYDAISYNDRPIVIEPCCSSATEEIQRANIADMERIGAEIWY